MNILDVKVNDIILLNHIMQPDQIDMPCIVTDVNGDEVRVTILENGDDSVKFNRRKRKFRIIGFIQGKYIENPFGYKANEVNDPTL